jgi:hypothetical protein
VQYFEDTNYKMDFGILGIYDYFVNSGTWRIRESYEESGKIRGRWSESSGDGQNSFFPSLNSQF